jgi:hypothetical protein
MNTEGSKLKLSTILSADVKDYSRLMNQDERGATRIGRVMIEANVR